MLGARKCYLDILKESSIPQRCVGISNAGRALEISNRSIQSDQGVQ